MSVTRHLKWVGQDGKAVQHITMPENSEQALFETGRSDEDNARALCSSHRAKMGSILALRVPRTIFQSPRHGDAYLSIQTTLLLICGAREESAGIYTCGADSASVRHIHFQLVTSQAPRSFHSKNAPLFWVMGGLLGVAVIVSISIFLVYLVKCCKKKPMTMHNLGLLISSSCSLENPNPDLYNPNLNLYN